MQDLGIDTLVSRPLNNKNARRVTSCKTPRGGGPLYFAFIQHRLRGVPVEIGAHSIFQDAIWRGCRSREIGQVEENPTSSRGQSA